MHSEHAVTPPNALYAYVGAFVDELARAGLRHVCICPGSRSTPLALCIAQHPGLRVWMHLDERSAAFFALGMARGGREPVALLCTSGTAAANFMPAVVEASLSRLPLIVLTADRPPELREVGSAQTIDQLRLYGSHAKWSVEMPTPGASEELLRYARVTAGRAIAAARGAPRGPVHLNFPFREPLVPTVDHGPVPNISAIALHGRADGQPFVTISEALPAAASPEMLVEIARHIREEEAGLIVCGPQDNPGMAAAVTALAALCGYPILADPLSALRCGQPRPASGDGGGAPIVDTYDAMLRDERAAAALAPKLVLRFGDIPTSKPLLQYLQRHAACRQIVVARGAWPDPTLLAAAMVDADPATFCRDLAGLLQRAQPAYLDDAPSADASDSPVPAQNPEFRRNPMPAQNPEFRRNPGIHSGEPHLSPSAEFIPHLPSATPHLLPNTDVVPHSGADSHTSHDLLTGATSTNDAPEPGSRGIAAGGWSRWQRRWLAANRSSRAALLREMEAMDQLFEGRVFAELADVLPAGATLWAGSSMPVRDLDTFFPARPQSIRMLANRGANGIDGVVSSALGAAALASGPTVLAIGDISFYHDMNGLLAAARHNLSLTIVLLNNDGGGIFSFLPQATALAARDDNASKFELLFGTPHGLDFRHAAALYDATYTRVTDWPSFRAAVSAGLGGGLHIVEVPTDREHNVALHRRCWPAVAEALTDVLKDV